MRKNGKQMLNHAHWGKAGFSSSTSQITKWSNHKTRFPVIAPLMQKIISYLQTKTPLRRRQESETQSR